MDFWRHIHSIAEHHSHSVRTTIRKLLGQVRKGRSSHDHLSNGTREAFGDGHKVQVVEAPVGPAPNAQISEARASKPDLPNAAEVELAKLTRALVFWTRIMGLAACIAAGVSSCQWIAMNGQLTAMRESGSQTERAIEQSHRLADLAADANGVSIYIRNTQKEEAEAALRSSQDSNAAVLEKATESNGNAHNALVTVQRAFVFLDLFDANIINNQLMIMPRWRNSGNTPTRFMTNWVNFRVFDSAPPADFPFPDIDLNGNVVTEYNKYIDSSFIGPNATKYAETLTLDTASLDDVRIGRRRAFIWGWARYKDVFGSSHITRFCNEIKMIDMPQSQESNSPPKAQAAVRFPTYGRYNCADDECVQRGIP